MTTQTNPVSIETLAQRLNGNLWTKGEIRRIYLDRGYNTKKMSTKTYVYQKEDGTFGVSCKIECPSQAYQWIESQENEVIESVQKELEEALANTFYFIVNENGHKIDSVGNAIALNEFYNSDYYFSKEAAQEEINKNYPSTYSVEPMDRSDFEKEVAELRETIKAELKELEPQQKVVESKPASTINPITANTNTPQYGVNTKVKHGKFGFGVVTAESDNLIDITFDSVGVKQLVKKFVVLEIVE